MGLLGPDRYDAFFSYSHRDDEASGGFVVAFKKILANQLSAKPDLPGPDRTPAIFMDKDALSANGSLKVELGTSIAESFFLFVFVGDSYADSDWCGDELQWFIDKRFGGCVDSARNHIFVICMTKAGGDRVTKISGPLVKKFWSDQIRSNFYNDKGRPIAHFGSTADDDGELHSHPKFLNRVMGITETVIDRASNYRRMLLDTARPPQRPEPPAKPARVVLGAVTDDLIGSRTELANALRGRNIEVTLLSPDDLQSHDPEPLRQRLSGYGLMIQPISGARLLCQGVEGGHLALQRRAARRIVDFWWWSPLTGTAQPAPEEQDEDNLRFLDSARAEAGKGTAGSLAAEVGSFLRPDRGHAKILIESSEEELDCWEQIADLIRTLWGEKYRGVVLRDDALNFQNLRVRSPEALRGCHGVMLLYGQKDFEALRTQADYLWDSLIDVGVNPARAVASIGPPQRGEHENFVWPTIRFQRGASEDAFQVVNRNKLEVFVDRLHRAVTQSRNVDVVAPGPS